MNRFGLTALAACAIPASVFAADLKGSSFVVTNTFEGNAGGGSVPETDVSAFGLDNNKFAVVGDGVELPVFIAIYDVDVSGDMIRFTWRETDFSKQITGPTPEGNHDRNYFTFDLPEGVAIEKESFDADASDMLEGSVAPTAAVLGPNRIVIDNMGGVVRGVGFNPAFKVTFK